MNDDTRIGVNSGASDVADPDLAPITNLFVPVPIRTSDLASERVWATYLGISKESLANERRGGKIRYKRIGGKVFYLGQWIEQWLEKTCDNKPKQYASVRTSLPVES